MYISGHSIGLLFSLNFASDDMKFGSLGSFLPLNAFLPSKLSSDPSFVIYKGKNAYIQKSEKSTGPDLCNFSIFFGSETIYEIELWVVSYCCKE